MDEGMFKQSQEGVSVCTHVKNGGGGGKQRITSYPGTQRKLQTVLRKADCGYSDHSRIRLGSAMKMSAKQNQNVIYGSWLNTSFLQSSQTSGKQRLNSVTSAKEKGHLLGACPFKTHQSWGDGLMGKVLTTGVGGPGFRHSIHVKSGAGHTPASPGLGK